MKPTIIIISVLSSVICVLLALLQYYYMNYQRLVFEKYNIPVFDELIPVDAPDQKAVGYFYDSWKSDKTNLFSVLKTNFASYLYPGKMTRKEHRKKSKKADKISDKEVHHTLQAALSFKMLGKFEKAKKLFEHAAAMDPENSDVLNHFGEFMESNDIVTADELYCRVSI